MTDLATKIQADEHCGADFEMRNPMVQQAYNGFISYQPLYYAGCLTNDEGEYCYASAVNNASTPAASYVYYLPLGSQLPSGSNPGCSACLRNTMAVYATFATDATQPLSDTYGPAAELLDDSCGNRFVEAVKVSTGGASRTPMAGLGISTLLALIYLFIFV